MNERHAGPWYHQSAMESGSLRDIANRNLIVLDALKAKFPKLSAIAGTGHSGSTVVGALAVVSDYNPILVRKYFEGCHSSSKVSGLIGDFDYVIVDDLVDTGDTVNMIIENIANRCNDNYYPVPAPRCIAVLTYGGYKESHMSDVVGLPIIAVKNREKYTDVLEELAFINSLTNKQE